MTQISNGMLCAMEPAARARAIRQLPAHTRCTLAHLATLGAAAKAQRAAERLEAGQPSFALLILNRDVIRLSNLAAELTADDDAVEVPPSPKCPRCRTQTLHWHDGWGYQCTECAMFVCIPNREQADDEILK